MILEVKKWPESQDVMHNDGWFFIMAGDGEKDPLGNSAYARIIDNKNNKGDKMTAPSKAKGNRFEREVVKKVQDIGLNAKRAWGSDGRSTGMHEEVDILIGDDYKIQAKCRKSIASFLQPTEHVDAVVCKQDRGEILIILRFEDWLKANKKERQINEK